LAKCKEIVGILEALQKNCARTADNLNNVLLNLKEQLKKLIEKNSMDIK
jgi:hypothetical protein